MIGTILRAGLVAGVLDISAASIQWSLRGVSPVRVLQAIASGVMGRESFQGGFATAALGLGLHFVIAFGAAAVYTLASRKLRFLIQSWPLAGAIYGIAVWAFMAFVVVPLSRVAPGKMTLESVATGILIHVLCVGLPIAWIVRKAKLAMIQ